MPPPDSGDRVGLCLDCRHVRLVGSRTGQSYHRCGRSDDDGRYPRFPRLPVLRCDGHDPVEPARGGAEPVDASP